MSSPDNKNNPIKPSQSSWYAKLHPIGTAQQQTKTPKRPLNLSIFFRIWLAVALILILSGIVAFTQLFGYIKPTAQQVIEDTLLDTSQLLAASLRVPLSSGQLYDESYQRQLDTGFASTQTTINGSLNKDLEPTINKQTDNGFRVYVTDNNGLVIYDSWPMPYNAEGEDYSRWNDIYLTLKGQYGARSTISKDSGHNTSIMYVAQPIRDELGEIIGVVSVGKPVASILPYLNDTRQRMLITTLLVSIAALILAGLVAWWLKQSITLVTQYTGSLAEDTKKPYFYLGHELNSLTDTIETMKHRLENRAYVSDYVHTLTHELKSPLTAIRASSELLEDDGLDTEDRHMLNQSIGEQSIKMQQLIDRLLLLAKVEQPTFRLNRQPVALLPMLQSLIKDSSPKLQQRHLDAIELYVNEENLLSHSKNMTLPVEILAKTTVFADSFWLLQALQNVLDNAIYFAANKVTIHIYNTTAHSVVIDIFNDGKQLPDYAVSKVFDRYFSLSHQSQLRSSAIQSDLTSQQPKTQTTTTHTSAKKGTGLGLTLVKQVIEHHGGSVIMHNVGADSAADQLAGVMVRITLPLFEK